MEIWSDATTSQSWLTADCSWYRITPSWGNKFLPIDNPVLSNNWSQQVLQTFWLLMIHTQFRLTEANSINFFYSLTKYCFYCWWLKPSLLFFLLKPTRSLGIRLRVKPFRLKNFFEDICCATLVRWAMPTTPRRTNFYMN